MFATTPAVSFEIATIAFPAAFTEDFRVRLVGFAPCFEDFLALFGVSLTLTSGIAAFAEVCVFSHRTREQDLRPNKSARTACSRRRYGGQ